VFVPAYGSLRRVYCTTECRDAAMRKVRSGSSHRRRAARHGCEYEPISKLQVFERDGWRCYLCGCATPRHLSGTTEPNAPELEHVVPLARGGSHTWGNVRCACRSCNRAKAASLPTGQDRTGQEPRRIEALPMVNTPAIDAPAAC
jgi:5-methylcytosine-specific restriction endonuclease McrA